MNEACAHVFERAFPSSCSNIGRRPFSCTGPAFCSYLTGCSAEDCLIWELVDAARVRFALLVFEMTLGLGIWCIDAVLWVCLIVPTGSTVVARR